MRKQLCTVLLLLAVFLSGNANGHTLPVKPQADGASFSKKIVRKKDAIRIYPNPTRNGSIKVSSVSSERLYFYIFDLEGVLVSRLILKAKEKKTITDLKKGIYLYDVFREDESIEQGKIIVK